ncbi:hypothetical protein D3C87_1277450 [compost metagenome]
MAPLITMAVRFQVANTSSPDRATITVRGKLPTRLKVYRRCCSSTLDTLSKLPLPSRNMRTTLGRVAKLLPIELPSRNGFCANRTPSSLMMASVLPVPMSRLLNN